MLGIALLLTLAGQAGAAGDRCNGRPPLVSQSETARAIFVAVELDYGKHADRGTKIIVLDEGDAWHVGRQGPPVVDHADGTLTITTGGGGLSMRIAKCDGAISKAHFAR